LPFLCPAIIEEFRIKYLITLFLKEQLFNYGCAIVEICKVAHNNCNYASVKAVDATHYTYLVHPVRSVDCCVHLIVVKSQIEVD